MNRFKKNDSNIDSDHYKKQPFWVLSAFASAFARTVSSPSDIAKNKKTQHEAVKIVNYYQQAVSHIPGVKEVRYKIRKRSIEFVVLVDRIRRKLSHRLSQIESELCDEYTEWFFEFEHLSSPTLPRQYQSEYSNLFSSE